MVKSMVGLRRRHIAFVLVTCIAAAGGIAYAAIPDATGVIHGCYRVSTDDQKGQLRAVSEPGNCRSNELPIDWSVTGPQGPPGADGEDGADGEPFSGTFTSPNGLYSLSVTDAGIVLAGAGSRIALDATGIEIRSASDLELLGGANVRVESSGNATVRAGATLSHHGAIVRLNSIGGCSGAARVGDQVSGTAAPTGVVSGFILTGAPTVCVG
jgi:hypothetical protein